MDIKAAKERKLQSLEKEMNKVFAKLAELEEAHELLNHGGKFSFTDCFRYHHQGSLASCLLMRPQDGREPQYKI